MPQNTKSGFYMRAVLFCIGVFIGCIPALSAQDQKPPKDEASAVKDSAKSRTASSAIANTHPSEYNRDRITARNLESKSGVESQTNSAPIRDWNNPAGFMGYSSNAHYKSQKQKKKKKPQKYHPHQGYHYKEKGRCPRF